MSVRVYIVTGVVCVVTGVCEVMGFCVVRGFVTGVCVVLGVGGVRLEVLDQFAIRFCDLDYSFLPSQFVRWF